MSELLRWSLVDYKPLGQDYGRYKFHDLARLFASARQSEESKAIVHKRHAAYYKELLSAADSLYLEGGSGIQTGLALFEREWANIKAGQAWTESQMAEGSAVRASRSFGYAMTILLPVLMSWTCVSIPQKRFAGWRPVSERLGH